MAKKNNNKKKSTPKRKKVSVKKTAKKVTKKAAKKKLSSKKRNPKGAGRKPNVKNKYNTIKSAISAYYKSTIGRGVKHYEMKVIYSWINQQYKNQSLRYIIMNIDVIIDNFWTEYCNMYPIEIKNHALFFDWYYLKNYLDDEKDYHYPSDIIMLDLSEIGYTEPFEFFFDDYLASADEAYRLCKEAGIKNTSPPPNYFLERAYCDIAKKGNVFKYKLLIDGEIPSEPLTTPPVSPTQPVTPVVQQTPTPVAPETAISAPTTPVGDLTPQQIEMELARERLKKEYELKELKLKALADLLKQKTITFDEYMAAIKSL